MVLFGIDACLFTGSICGHTSLKYNFNRMIHILTFYFLSDQCAFSVKRKEANVSYENKALYKLTVFSQKQEALTLKLFCQST